MISRLFIVVKVFFIVFVIIGYFEVYIKGFGFWMMFKMGFVEG